VFKILYFMRQKWFAVLFVALFLLSASFAASHHHKKIEDYLNCPTCSLISHHASATQVVASFDGTPFLAQATFQTFSPDPAPSFIVFACSTRGPPK